MKNELFNILANSNKDIDNQKLMDYLSGKLSEREKNELEKTMSDSDFMNDAVEGLENLGGDQEKIKSYVEELNKELQVYIKRKKLRRKKRPFKENPWIYIYIILILLFTIIGYIIIRQYLK